MCMQVLWDAATGQPLRTIANPHPAGVALMDVSADGQWLMVRGRWFPFPRLGLGLGLGLG